MAARTFENLAPGGQDLTASDLAACKAKPGGMDQFQISGYCITNALRFHQAGKGNEQQHPDRYCAPISALASGLLPCLSQPKIVFPNFVFSKGGGTFAGESFLRRSR